MSAPAVSARTVPARTGRRSAAHSRRWAGAAVFLLVLAVLFAAYLQLSKTYAENSDEANILLMASDLAHGNLLLSGWTVSDVPFITTELPEIALLVRLFGLHLSTAHVAAALTYTIVLATAMLLSSGWTTPRTPRGTPDGQNRHFIGRADASRSSGWTTPRAPLVRMAVVLAIMLAPQPGVGVFVLLFSVGHIGTAAPVMATWLFLDRYWPGPGPGGAWPRRAWCIPVIAGLLLTWALLADPLVLVIAVIPVLVTAAARVVPDLRTGQRTGAGLRLVGHALARHWAELSLAAAAAAAYLAAWCGQRLLHAAGGYTQQAVPFSLDPVNTWWAHSRIVAHGLLEMFGAFFIPGNAVNYLSPGNDVAAPPLTGLAEAVAISRLGCVALAVVGVCAAGRYFFRRDADLVSQLLLVGIVANLAAYIPSSLADHTALNAREFAPVLPFAAVLAARMLGDRLAVPFRRRQRPGDGQPGDGQPAAGRPAAGAPGGWALAGQPWCRRLVAGGLAALFCWYGLGLVQEARLPAAANPFSKLEAFLVAHRLRSGIGGYWDASVITVGTGGAVTIRAVTQGCLQPYAWEAKQAWYNPAGPPASFLLTSGTPGYFSQWNAAPAALRALSTLFPSAATLDPGGGYQVHDYPGNLLARLPQLASC